MLTDARRDPTIAWGLLLAFAAAVLRIRPLGAPDTWWHLNVGRIVLETGQRRFPDRMAIEVKEQFVAGEWGFDVVAWGLYSLGGPDLLVVFAGFAAAVSCLLVWRLAREWGAAPWTALGIAGVVVAATSWRFFPRPHILFLCFLPAALILAHRASRATDARRRIPLAGLLGLVGLWAQCHPSVIIAPAVVGLAGLPFVIGRHEAREGLLGLHRDLWIALVLLALIPFTSPYGLGILGQVTGHSGTNSVLHIGEMQPLALSDFWPPTSRSLLAVEALVLVALLGIGRRRRLPIGPLLLGGLGLMMTLNTHRFRAAWAILLVPLVADVVRFRREDRLLATGMAALAALGVWSATPGWNPGGPSDTWQSIDRDWAPEALGDALDAFDVRGDVFNDYDAGGYIGFRRFEQVRVFIDGRTPPYFTDDHFWAARQAQADPSLFDRLDREHQFSAAIVGRDAALCSALDEHDGWMPAWFDGSRALFVRPGVAPELRVLSPCATRSNVKGCQQGDQAVHAAEIDRLLAVSPTSAYLGRLATMLDVFCLGRNSDWSASWGLDPDNPELHWALARGAVKAGDPQAAIDLLEPDRTARSLRLRVETEAARGNTAGTLEAAWLYVEAEGDSTPPDILGHLATACLAQDDQLCALHQGLRAALRGDDRGRDVLVALDRTRVIPHDLRRLMKAALAD
jgi:hypothetical protein